MPNISKAQIELLVRLQEIAIETNKIRSVLNSVDHRIDTLNNGLKEFEKIIEEKETILTELDQKYRSYEADVQMNMDRISKSKEKLRSAKTNKEYQSSVKEIEDIEAINSNIEDEMLNFLDHMESAENTLTQTRAEYTKRVDQTNVEKVAIENEAVNGKQQLVRLDEDWQKISAQIDPDLLEAFNKTKLNHTNGIAIVTAKNAVCQGCNMNIPPQLYNELHRFDRLINCPHCERIIYWDDHNGRPE
ncbi:MAG: C4-type zinc ribbon domain-containing protein [Desulfobacteraceae bacterium]|jgi:predicted  nucleic acid-binding Zn-ribbon protein